MCIIVTFLQKTGFGEEDEEETGQSPKFGCFPGGEKGVKRTVRCRETVGQESEGLSLYLLL